MLGPRWEEVVRAHLETGAGVGAVEQVGVTVVPDRARRAGHEVDLVEMRCGKAVAIGEAKVRGLGGDDLERLRHIRDLLGLPEATLVLASAIRVELPPKLAAAADVVTLTPADIYE